MFHRAAGRAFVALLIAVCAAAFNPLGGTFRSAPSAQAAPQSQPYIIGMVDTVTGPVAALGTSTRNGATMAVEEINKAGGVDGHQLKLVFEDSGGTNETAITAATRLMDEKPQVVLGLSLSTQAFAAMPAITGKRAPVIVFGTNPKLTESGGEYAFSALPNVSALCPAAVSYALQDLHKSKVAILTTDDEFGVAANQMLVDTVKKLGAAVVSTQTLSTKAVDATPQLLKIKASGADVAISWLLENLDPLVFQQRHQLGLVIPWLSSAMLPKTVQQIASADIDGVYAMYGTNILADNTPAVRDFVTRFKARFGVPADEYGGGAFDIIHIIALGLKSATTPQQMRDYLAGLKNFQGVDGIYTATANRNLAQRAVVTRYDKDRNKVTVKTIQF